MPAQTCPAPEALERHVAGETDDGSIASHLASCAQCRSVHDRLLANNALLTEVARASRGGQPEATLAATAIPGYRILENIGAGGQGVVYKAIQLATKRIVALKVLLGGSFAEPRRRERFEREIELVASLHHPSIVTVFDSGVTPDGRRYFAMEHITGKPLLEYVRAGTISLRERLLLFACICDALSAPHLRGIVHRDLKPANLLIDAAGAPHILDFGLAKVLGDDPLRGGTTPTISGEFMGTFAYAAPEQLRGRPELIDIRADVYALGVLLYELLTDRPPYTLGAAIGDAIKTITETQPPRPSAVRAGLGDELNTIALKALAKEPERRYQSAGELARDVQRYLAGEPIDAKRDSTWYMLRKAARKHRTFVLAGAAALVLLVAFSISMTVLARRVERQRQRADESAHGLAQSLTQANIERGRLMTEIGNIVVAERLLWREYLTHPTDAPAGRQAYWALWELYSQQPCLATIATGLEYGPALAWLDAGTIAATDRTGHVAFWDIATLTRSSGTELSGWALQPGNPMLNETGAIAVGSDADRLLVWDLHSGRHRLTIPFSDTWAPGRRPVAVSADGKRLVCALSTDQLALYDADDGRLLSTSAPHPELQCDMRRMTFTADATRVVVVDRAGRGGVWDLQSGLFESAWEGVVPSASTTTAVAPDSRRVAVAGGYGFCVLPLDADQPVCGASWNGGEAFQLAFSPDGQQIASMSTDRVVRLWSAESCGLLAEVLGSPAQSTALRYHASGSVFASGAADGTVKLWDARPAAALRLTPGRQVVTALAFTPDGGELLTGFDDPGRLTAHDPRTGTLLRAYAQANGTYNAVACTPDCALVVGARMDATILVSDRRTAREVVVFRDPAAKRAHGIAAHPDGRHIVSGHDDGFVRLWDVQERRLVAGFVGQRSRVPSLCYSPDGRQLTAAGADGHVVIWDADTRAVLHDITASFTTERSVAFSPDSRTVVSGGDDGALKLWDTSTGRRIATLEAHQQDVFTIAYSPDGRLIASGDRGGVIMLWDAATGRNLAKIVQHTDMVFGVTFSPDSRYLASGARDATAVVLDLTYFEQHIAGNLEHQLSKLEATNTTGPSAVELSQHRSWAQSAWHAGWTRHHAPSP